MYNTQNLPCISRIVAYALHEWVFISYVHTPILMVLSEPHQLNLQFISVNFEIFGRILLSLIALKDIFAMF